MRDGAFSNQPSAVDLSAGGAEYLRDACVHQLFEAQVERTPQAIAVVFEEQQLTYAELNRRANQLATSLRAQGVAPEVLVALYMERSLAMVIGLLAILKAGGGYVPLDPTYPKERLTFMLADARIAVLLTQQDLVESLPTSTARTICLDAEQLWVTQQEAANPASGVQPGNLAYVIYTSGSTGQPKGVTVEHRQLTQYTRAILERLHIGTGLSFAMVQPLTVDSCITMIFPALCTGGCLHVITFACASNSYLLADYFRCHQIACLKIAPSHLAALHTSSHAEQIMPRQRLIIGGEASRWNRVRRLPAMVPGCVVFNHYGPTETTVGVLTYQVGTEDEAEEYTMTPLGQPLAGVQVYLLDEHLQPVEAGEPGELYIGGAHLARGYLNRPELVAERFVPDPFSGERGARLYRTGDLARSLPRGEIDFLGRVDDQVKIRGFRIELQEIEAVLAQHANVREVAVLSKQDNFNNQRLVACVVPVQLPAPTDGELRRFLSKHLPDYMLPSAFMLLEELPRTAHGKVDRRALSLLSPTRTAVETIYVAPGTELERLLASMWQELLDREKIGIHDNFFEAGGDSIKGAIFINRLQERLGEIVHIVALFDAPTVADFAAYLSRYYQHALARKLGAEYADISATGSVNQERTARIDAEKVAQLRQVITPLPPRVGHTAPEKNPPALFVLAPPRSGTTLLRVMLGKHPLLFAPPELGLLSFNTLAERKSAFSGRQGFRLEGTIRAIMEIQGCDVETAKETMARFEQQDLTVQQFYRVLQEWVGEKMLVDKTPSYAIDEEVLKRAEDDFANARYLHLIRHPYGMIQSFEETKLDRIFFWDNHAFSTRELAELVWLISHENILRFLGDLSADRHYRVYFEDLVKQPGVVMEGICQFLGLEFHPAMAQPYQAEKMTDGLYPMSRMLGDMKFYEHKHIDATVADRWKERAEQDFLGDMARQLAETLGYEMPHGPDGPPVTNNAYPLRTTFTDIRPVVRAGDDSFALSFAQQQLWFLDQWEPASPLYNMQRALRLSGELDIPILEQSLNEVVRRHEALRTTFLWHEGRPVQRIAPVLHIPLTVVELDEVPTERRAQEAERRMAQEVRRPFDLTTGPLMRVHLFRLAAQEHVLLLLLHHIITDGWSMGVFFRELTVIYDAFFAGKRSPLPALPIQYADFALWQRDWLQDQRREKLLTYWRGQLAQAPALLELSIARPRPRQQTYQGAWHSFWLSPALTQAIKDLGRREGVTLFMTLLAAFQTLLFRYSGQEDLVVGTPIANRTHPQTEPLIGFFANALVLRTDLSGQPGFRELLARVRRVCLEAFANQDLPFEKLVEVLRPERALSHSPLVQVVFALQNATSPLHELLGLRLQSLEIESGTAKFELKLAMADTDQGLHGVWEYNTDLFDAAIVERMQGHFQTLLEGLVADPDQSLATLPLLPVAERQRLLIDWNAARINDPDARCLHQLFEVQVQETPDALALVYEDEHLTYSELNARANQLARYLQSRGVGPEVPVGLLMERSLPLVVGLLAILKAGGAYVPLDPSYPQEQLAFLLADTQVPVLLTRSQLLVQLSERPEEVFCLDREWDRLAQQSSENPASAVTAAHMAYLIYTSGSTGRPKGTVVEHHSAVSLLRWVREQFTPADLSAVLASTSLCFDLSVFELFAPLCLGGTVFLVENVLQLPTLPAAGAITLINTVPSALAALLRKGPLPSSVRVVNLAGESLPQTLVQQLYTQETIQRVFNLYGPSEDTTYSTCALIQKGSSLPPPIGRPLPNTQVYLLDQYLQPVPLGVPGELYLAGAGLTRGYLNRPDLTAERFLPNPFGYEAGTRLYRTGDRARYLPDGNLEFLGRLDSQVKIRGYRIELGEIEAALQGCPAVHEAVVVAREDIPADKRLVAYVVPRPSQKPTVSELHTYLKAKLPRYMLPSAFVLLEALPITQNGKLDRQALPVPAESLFEAKRAYTEPRNYTEAALVDIWTQVLGIRQIGIYDNFFDLGGHSLLAVQIVARVHETLQAEIPLRTFFELPTVAQQAVAIVQGQVEQTDSELLMELLAELERLPEAEAQTMLAGQRQTTVEENASE